MTIDPRHIAADYLAALDDNEAAAFVAEVRTPPAQITEEQLAGMAPAEINKARRAGLLDNLLGRN